MSNSSGFLRNAFVYGVGGAAAQIAAALLLPLYTHYLTPADYGVLELIERTGAIVVLLLLGHGIRMATFAFYCQATTAAHRQQTFSTIAVVLWAILLVGSLAGLGLSPWLARWLQISDPRIVAFGIVVVMLECFLSYPITLLQARVEAVTFVTANIIVAVTRMLLIAMAVVWLGLGVWGVLVASALTFTLFGIALTSREIRAGFPRPDPDIARQVIAFALPLLPSGLMGLALAGADRYFLVAYSGGVEVGIYSLGAKLGLAITGLAITPLWKVWTAALYDYYEATDAALRVGRVVLRILFVQVFVALGVSIFSRELVDLLAPTEYASAAGLIPILALAGTLQLANNLFEGAFWSQRDTKWKPVLTACSATVAIIAFYFLVPRWGGLGAATALALAYAAQASLTFVVTQRIFWVEYDWRAVGAAAGASIVLYLVSTCGSASYASLVGKFVLWLMWPLLLWFLGIVSEEEKKWCLRQIIRGRQLAGKWLSAAPS
jgi:O-antigen/teichoic acid export membrane protein